MMQANREALLNVMGRADLDRRSGGTTAQPSLREARLADAGIRPIVQWMTIALLGMGVGAALLVGKSIGETRRHPR
jgi:hypothetical protein